MLSMKINLEGDGMLKDIPPERLVFSDGNIHVGVLEHGMESGLPFVGIALEVDGMTVLGQTSLKLYLLSAFAIYARYGDAGTGITMMVGKEVQ